MKVDSYSDFLGPDQPTPDEYEGMLDVDKLVEQFKLLQTTQQELIVWQTQINRQLVKHQTDSVAHLLEMGRVTTPFLQEYLTLTEKLQRCVHEMLRRTTRLQDNEGTGYIIDAYNAQSIDEMQTEANRVLRDLLPKLLAVGLLYYKYMQKFRRD